MFPLERFKAFISLLSTSFCYLHHRVAPENWKIHFLWRLSLMHCVVNLFIVSLQHTWWIRKEIYPNRLFFVKRSNTEKRLINYSKLFVTRIQTENSTELTGSLLSLFFFFFLKKYFYSICGKRKNYSALVRYLKGRFFSKWWCMRRADNTLSFSVESCQLISPYFCRRYFLCCWVSVY